MIEPPAPIDETIDSCSGSTCSLFPPWHPLMKTLIEPLVLFDKPSVGAVVKLLQVYHGQYLLSFAEADSSCFCIYLSPLL